MNASTRYSRGFRERASRLVLAHRDDLDSPWTVIASVSAKIGCSTETLRT